MKREDSVQFGSWMQAWGGSCAGLVFARRLSTRCCGGWGWRVAELVHGAQGRGGECLAAWWVEVRKGGEGSREKLIQPLFAAVGGLSSWRNLVTLGFSRCTLSFFSLMAPRVFRPCLPLTRFCHAYSSFFATLALQFKTSELVSPYAWCLVSKRHSGDVCGV